jgi:hypothetical protein
MNPTQRRLVLVGSCVLAMDFFLLSGPFSDGSSYMAGFYPAGTALADLPRYEDNNAWNPLRGTGLAEKPLFGMVLPLALVGFGLFVWFGRPEGGSGSR